MPRPKAERTELDYLKSIKTVLEGSIFEHKDEVMDYVERKIKSVEKKYKKVADDIENGRKERETAQKYLKKIVSNGKPWTREDAAEALKTTYNMNMQLGTISRLFKNLEEEGYVTRTHVRRDSNTKIRIVAYELAK